MKDEVKRALRRSVVVDKPRGKRGKGMWGQIHYPPLNYKLPMPTLEATYKRLAKSEIEIWDDVTCERMVWDGRRYEMRETTEYEIVETFTGPKAAEQWVEYRRAQLGLDLMEPVQRHVPLAAKRVQHEELAVA